MTTQGVDNHFVLAGKLFSCALYREIYESLIMNFDVKYFLFILAVISWGIGNLKNLHKLLNMNI